jgi:hypothetical protein
MDEGDEKTRKELDIPNIPWPKKGDELFKPDEDWWNNACLNFSHDMSIGYIYGYKKAADILVNYIIEVQIDQDYLVYPIVFLYRHHLELILKEVIKKGNGLLDIYENVSEHTHHKIIDLWQKCKKIIKDVWPEGSSDDLDAVDDCLTQFYKVDPTSMSFRYPTDKKGNPIITGIKHINLRNLAEIMERISTFFEGVETGISEYLSLKCEMESEYSPDF